MNIQNEVIMPYTIVSLAAMILALVIEFLLISQVLLRFKNKTHKADISYSGGICFLPVILLTILPLYAISMREFPLVSLYKLLFIVAGGAILLYTGVKDDLKGISWLQKLSMQLIASGLLVVSGNYFGNLHGLFGIHELPAYIGMALTIVFTVGTVNMFYFINRINGLAGTLGCIAALTLGVMFLSEQHLAGSILSFTLAGVLIPFWYFNHSRRRKAFMGASGSYIVGFSVAFLVLTYSAVHKLIPGFTFSQPIVMIWSILFVPMADMGRLIFLRLFFRKSASKISHAPIHTKLIALGYSHKETSVVLGIYAVVLILLNVILQQNQVNLHIILLLDFGMGFLFNMDLSRQRKKAKQSFQEEESRIPVTNNGLDLLQTKK